MEPQIINKNVEAGDNMGHIVYRWLAVMELKLNHGCEKLVTSDNTGVGVFCHFWYWLTQDIWLTQDGKWLL